MEPGDDLPLTANYFELGMTSLLVVELKQQLETVLGGPIDTTTLYANPTIAQVIQHLCDECLPDLFATRPTEVHQELPTTPHASAKRLLDDLLTDLYQD
jgi:aryl carrier-like protein